MTINVKEIIFIFNELTVTDSLSVVSFLDVVWGVFSNAASSIILIYEAV